MFFLTYQRGGEYDEEVHLTRDGLHRVGKKFKCSGGCEHLVDCGSMAYCKNFYKMVPINKPDQTLLSINYDPHP